MTTFWGDPVAAPKSEPPNFENRAEGDDSPVLVFSSCDATVLNFIFFSSLYNHNFRFVWLQFLATNFLARNFLIFFARKFLIFQFRIQNLIKLINDFFFDKNFH